ncbi:hypothetical protein B0T18DRAFT_393170 [Schizothecium vesticola]|uniref:Uncharacterized protein n=1 Tax=Schizothecium vesticola TaxID=314040 RepID=A0AA40JYV9_9PEZI|nr:hypothetical protein B0T18DRAFT_393170 [Schizothecium vesticola]
MSGTEKQAGAQKGFAGLDAFKGRSLTTWKKKRPPPIANTNTPPQTSIPSNADNGPNPVPRHGDPSVSAPNPDPRPITGIPSRPTPTKRASEPAHASPVTLIDRAVNTEQSVDAAGNCMKEFRQKLAALKSLQEAGTLTLISKVDALTSQHKADTLALTRKIDALTSSLTGKFDMLASKVDTLTSSPKIKSEGLDGDTTVETSDKPTMAMISDLQTRSAKLEADNRELLEIVEAQGIYFQDHRVVMGRVLEC